MKWLITGGAGFIGSHFIKYALKKGVQIVNVDAMTYAGHAENLEGVENIFPVSGFSRNRVRPYEFIHADISDEKTMREIFKMHPNVNAIINFAAESHVDRSLEEPDAFIRSNVQGTRVMLEGARMCNARFLQVSTDEVYGSLGAQGSFLETSPLNPSSPYSASKAAADLMVRAYIKSYGVDGVITRCSNNFGPNQDPEKFIPNSVIRAVRGDKIPIYGDGRNIRDWLFVQDHCVAIDFALWYGRRGDIYNIGGGNERNNLEIISVILDELKVGSDCLQFVKDRPGHDRRYAVNSDKLRALGWRPQANFDMELRRTVRWYAENQSWWKKILGLEEYDQQREQQNIQKNNQDHEIKIETNKKNERIEIRTEKYNANEQGGLGLEKRVEKEHSSLGQEKEVEKEHSSFGQEKEVEKEYSSLRSEKEVEKKHSSLSSEKEADIEPMSYHNEQQIEKHDPVDRFDEIFEKNIEKKDVENINFLNYRDNEIIKVKESIEIVEETAATKAFGEAAATKLTEEAAGTKPIREAAATKTIEEAAATKLTEEAAATKPIREAAATKLTEEAVGTKPIREAAATNAVEEAAGTKPIREAAETKAMGESAITKTIEEAAITNAIEDSEILNSAEHKDIVMAVEDNEATRGEITIKIEMPKENDAKEKG